MLVVAGFMGVLVGVKCLLVWILSTW